VFKKQGLHRHFRLSIFRAGSLKKVIKYYFTSYFNFFLENNITKYFLIILKNFQKLLKFGEAIQKEDRDEKAENT